MDRFNQFIEDVLSGRLVTGSLIKLAVNRHIKDLENPDLEFNENAVKKIVGFFERLNHWKGEWAGSKIKLEPHQVFYVGQLFGWKRGENRRFRTSFKMVARKNAKTTEAAIKAIYHMMDDNEPGAQVYSAATKEDQARICTNDAGQIILATPSMRSLFKVFYYKNEINRVVYKSSFMSPITSDSTKQDGFDPSWGIIDEFHAHPTDKLLNVLESGMGARRQPVIDVITTAGFHKEYPCYSALRKTAIDVLKGIKEDDTLLAMIFEMDEDDDWKDEGVWIKSNPNLDVSIKLDFLRTRFRQAMNEGGTKEVDFKTKNLNIWTDAAETWIKDEDWMKGDVPLPDLTGRECYAGLDLASTEDITALVLYFPGSPGYVIPYFFIPEDTLRDKTRDGADFYRWRQQGYVTVTPGNRTDYDYIIQKAKELKDQYQIKSLGYDPWNATQTAIYLQDSGFKVDEVRQGIPSMGEPTKKLHWLIISGELVHGGNPVLRWMCSNVTISRDSNDNYKMDKGKSSDKIDGMVALAIAICQWQRDNVQQPQFNVRWL